MINTNNYHLHYHRYIYHSIGSSIDMDFHVFTKHIILHGTLKQQTDFLKVQILFPNFIIFPYWLEIYNEIDDRVKRKIQEECYSKSHRKCVKMINNARNFMINGILFDLIAINNTDHSKIVLNIFADRKDIFDHLKTSSKKNTIIHRRNSVMHIPLMLTCHSHIDEIKVESFVTAVNYFYRYHISQISIHELILSVVEPNQDSENINVIFEMFRKISNLVTDTILSANNHKERIRYVYYFIAIAEKMLSIHNYEALFAIVTGLGHASVQRIKILWQTHKSYVMKFENLESIICHHKNYEIYRSHIYDKQDYIPYIGLVRSDIDHCLQNALYNDNEGSRTINVNCYSVLTKIIDGFENARSNKVKLNYKMYDDNIINFIRRRELIGDSKLYKKSYSIQNMMNTASNSGDTTTPTHTGSIIQSKSPRKLYDKIINNRLRSTKSLVRLPNTFNCDSENQIKKILEIVNFNSSCEKRIRKKRYEFIYRTPMFIWSHHQVRQWLKFIGLTCYNSLFDQNNINGYNLVEFKYYNFHNLGILDDHINLMLKFIDIQHLRSLNVV